MDLTIDCEETWFSELEKAAFGEPNATKTMEGRLAKEKYLKLKAGDHVRIHKSVNGIVLPDDFIDLEVTKVEKYSTFREMIEVEGLENILPGIQTIDDGVMIYRQWFSEKQEKEFCVVAMHFKLLIKFHKIENTIFKYV